MLTNKKETECGLQNANCAKVSKGNKTKIWDKTYLTAVFILIRISSETFLAPKTSSFLIKKTKKVQEKKNLIQGQKKNIYQREILAHSFFKQWMKWKFCILLKKIMWEQTLYWLQWYPWKQTSSHKTILKYTLQQQVGHIFRETLTDRTSLAIEEIPNAIDI